MNLVSKVFRRIRYFLKHKAVVLSYHRVASPDIDPWEISVSPENFEEQLQVLKKYEIVTPGQLLERLKSGQLKNNLVCITFDDGYQDNYLNARPLLEKYNLHSTIFIPVHFIGEKKEFWWDELQTIILGTHDLPKRLSISINAKNFEFDLGGDEVYSEEQYQKNASWIWYEEAKTKRAELYLELWKQLRPLKYGDINEVLEKLKEWSSFKMPGDDSGFPMTKNQLQSIVEHPLFNVGIHTVTHPALAYHTKEEQFLEIEKCKDHLEILTGTPINTIAYPYGVYNDDTIEVAKNLGIEIGFTTQGNPLQKGDHALKLSRCHVKNWNGKQFEKNLSKWFKGF